MLTSLSNIRRVINEALKAADASAVARDLENAVSKAGSRVRADVDASKGMFNIFVKHVSGDEEATEEALTNAALANGWSLLSRSDRRGLVWWFEPSAETKGNVQRKRLPNVLYHTTRTENVESILMTGLRPGQRHVVGTSRKYSPRVYMATRPEDAKAAAKSGGDWSMIAIDVSKLPKSMKLYVDQEFGNRPDGVPIAVYAVDAIPASALRVG